MVYLLSVPQHFLSIASDLCKVPFFAYQSGDREGFVVPEEVADGETVHCPGCDERMRPRGGEGQARHFLHVDNIGAKGSSGCEGAGSVGESDRHRRLKSLAASGLRSRFAGHDVDTCGLEVSIDVSDGPSIVSERRADALLQFEDPITKQNRFFGAGVVVEVQYRNEGKDVAAVTADYLQAGYSVYWAHECDFTQDQFRVGRFEQAFNERWPNAFAPYFVDADEALRNVESVEFGPQENLSRGWSFVDPRPDCDHGLHTGHRGIPFCQSCGTDVTRHDSGRLMYSPLGK
jgi:hypothetical protein